MRLIITKWKFARVENQFLRAKFRLEVGWNSLALLDKEDSGLIINFIYTHEGVRVYTKKVKQGKGEEYQLSEEEQRAIKESK